MVHRTAKVSFLLTLHCIPLKASSGPADLTWLVRSLVGRATEKLELNQRAPAGGRVSPNRFELQARFPSLGSLKLRNFAEMMRSIMLLALWKLLKHYARTLTKDTFHGYRMDKELGGGGRGGGDIPVALSTKLNWSVDGEQVHSWAVTGVYIDWQGCRMVSGQYVTMHNLCPRATILHLVSNVD